MKKILLAIALVSCFAIAGYSGTAKSAISVDLGPTIQYALATPPMFGIGAGYEWNFIIPNLSLALNVSYASYSQTIGSYTLSITLLAPGLFLRFYPISQAVSGLWVGAGYTYLMVIASIMGIPIIAGGSMIPIDVGYKWIITGDMGLFVEPYVGYGLVLGSTGTTTVGGGFDYGIRAGLAF